MTVYNCLLEPKKSAIKDGAVRLAISIQAPNKKVAENIIVGKLWEQYPDNGDSYFKPKIWEDAPGQDRSALGVFNEEFATTHDFDGEKWINITPPTDNNMPSESDIVDLMAIPSRERFAAVLLFSDSPIDGSMYSQVVDYLDNLDSSGQTLEDVDRFNFNVLVALHNNEPVKHMHVEGLNNLIQAIFTQFEKQTPGKAAISQFIKRWLENPGKRDEILAAATDSNKAENVNTDNLQSPKRGYKHTYATLDREIALALRPHPCDQVVLSGDLIDADKIIADDREDFKRWSASLRTTPQILKYDRNSIFGVIQQAPASDTYHFPDSLRRHITSWLEANGHIEEGETKPEKQADATVKNLGDGKFSIMGLVQETPPNPVPEQKENAPAVSDTQAEQARETLTDMGYGVYATQEEPEEKLSERAEKLVTQTEQLAARINADEQHQQAVASVEKSINESPADGQENLALWKRVFRTDERFTKAFAVNGGGTSINGTYMTMLATREFGPKGIGWGVDILEERFDAGAPILRKVKGQDGNQTWDLIQNGSGGILTEQNHVIKIKLWFIQDGVRGEEVAYGCTPYIYDSKYGPICDGEATKKSLTDATKKALSSLGFSADIFMGLYDNPEYRQQNKAEFAIKNASENAEDATRLRQELDDKLTRVAKTLETGVSENEINKVFSSVAREVEVHRKSAEAKGDQQHASYLKSRLVRLTKIKDSRLAELNSQEKTA